MSRKVVVTISLDAEADRDILRWLERQENRSAAIREALREAIAGGLTLGDVYQAVKALERRLSAGVVVAASGCDPAEEEPPDAAAALDALANL